MYPIVSDLYSIRSYPLPKLSFVLDTESLEGRVERMTPTLDGTVENVEDHENENGGKGSKAPGSGKRLFETVPISVEQVSAILAKYWPDYKLGDRIKASQNHTFHAKKTKKDNKRKA